MSYGGGRLTVGQNCGRAQVASIRRQARPKDPPGFSAPVPTHTPASQGCPTVPVAPFLGHHQPVPSGA